MSMNNSHLPSSVKNSVIPRFTSERVRITDQFDPDTGLPLYRTIELVELLIPGDKGNAPVKKVNDGIRDQFRAEYDRWKATGKSAEIGDNGVPLSNWPQIPKEMVAGLQHANVYTVEQLAALSDSQCQIRGTLGLRKYRDMAAAFIDSSRAAAPIAALSHENDLLKNRLALVEKQLEQMTSLANTVTEKVKALEGATPNLSTPDIGITED